MMMLGYSMGFLVCVIDVYFFTGRWGEDPIHSQQIETGTL